jgi:hypothetical protein
VSVVTPKESAELRHLTTTNRLAMRAAQEVGLQLDAALLRAERQIDELCAERDSLRAALTAAEDLRKRTEDEHHSLALRQRESIERLHKELEAALDQPPSVAMREENERFRAALIAAEDLRQRTEDEHQSLALRQREENDRLREGNDKLGRAYQDLRQELGAKTRALADLNESLLPPIGVTVPSQVISTPRYVVAEPHAATGLPAYVYPEIYTSPVVALQKSRIDDRPRSLYRLVPHDFPIVSEPFARQLVLKAESLGHAELAAWLRARLPFPLGHAEGSVLP